jgi:AcrR family transcriptional regulator
MSAHERKARARAERHQMIISAARELAEAEGWDAVTTRNLAERIEYSQPVLYGHFRGKDEIVGAVALEGFAELTAALRQALPSGITGRAAVEALVNGYVTFAMSHSAVYDAMFNLHNGFSFGSADTPATLREGFTVLLDTLREVARATDPEVFTEICWAALHGLITLTRAGRVRPEGMTQRLEAIVNLFVGAE